MTIGRICSREVDLVRPDENARSAGERMRTRSVGTLVVIDADRRPIGIVTDRDLAVRVVGEGRDPNATSIRDVMSMHPRVVSEKTPIEDALARMRALNVRRLPVVGANGDLVYNILFQATCAAVIAAAKLRLPSYAAVITYSNIVLALVMVLVIAGVSSYVGIRRVLKVEAFDIFRG